MSRFSFSTACSSPTSTTTSSPTSSPGLPTTATISPHSSLTVPYNHHHHHHNTPRWRPLSPDGLPRSSRPSQDLDRLVSPKTTPATTPSPSPRLRPAVPPDPAPAHRNPHAAAGRKTTASPAPAGPAAATSSPPPPGDGADGHADARGFRRLGRTVGRGLMRCSSCFRRRPDNPEDVEEVPKPPHWSDL